MIGPIERKPTVRMAGYLEKRGKMKLVVCRWKRWWFVLEGRLLLYYKSQLEYLNLSPCRGSLNMGLAASVRPGKGLELTVVTRSQSVTLRAANKRDHEQWLQALVDAMALSSSPHGFKSRPILHFRYNDQDRTNNLLERARNFKSPYTALPSELSTSRTQSGSCETSTSSSHSSSLGTSQTQSDRCLLRRVLSDSRTLLQRPYKRPSVHNSARLSKLTLSDTSLPVGNPARSQSPTEKCHSLLELRSDVIRSIESIRVSDNCKCVVSKSNDDELPLTGSKDSKLSNSIKIELNLEDVSSVKGNIFKEQKIGNIKIVLDGCTIYGSRKSSTSEVDDAIDNRFYENVKEIHIHSNKDVKSDTDLTMKRRSRCQSLSCENMHTLDRSIGSTYQDICSRLEYVKRDQRILQINSDSETVRKPNRPKRRSNSFLSRLRENKTDEQCGQFERQNTIRKRLSFLRKMWRKREKKVEDEEFESVEYESIPIVTELPTPQVQKAEQLLSSLRQEEMMGPEPEPPPDYDVSLTEDQEAPPILPPRMKHRPPSPFHDVPRNNRPVAPLEDDYPPPLPVKTKSHRHQQEPENNHELEESGVDSMNCETSSNDAEQKLEEADSSLVQLTEINRFEVQEILEVTLETDQRNILQVLSAPEPIYDVPRPHLSLVATIRRQNVRSETFSPTQFLCSTPLIDSDSLDPVIDRLDAEMTPDSLECDSAWSLTQTSEVLNSSSSSHTGSLHSHFITTDDKLFPDSLNS